MRWRGHEGHEDLATKITKKLATKDTKITKVRWRTQCLIAT